MNIDEWQTILKERLAIGHPDPAVADAVAYACLRFCESDGGFYEDDDPGLILERLVDPTFGREVDTGEQA